MPLRVRVSTALGGSEACKWLATYVCLAGLYGGRAELTKDEPDEAVVEIAFPGKEKGARFMRRVAAMNDAPLAVGTENVIRVEEV